jgi:hypothetical protein
MSDNGWIGVDLDGTLAFYDKWRGAGHIGDPIPLMAARVSGWIKSGVDVRIFTARVSDKTTAMNGDSINKVMSIIQDWTFDNFGVRLPITCQKDYDMVQLWDDRAVQVVPNSGERVDGEN